MTTSMAQKMAPPVVDSLLQEVVVSVFNTRVKWKDAPAAVAVLNSKELNRFSLASFVPVLNTIPGIRMEERSPGSYRLSVRGSLLRSPFGIRNIKVYWNEIPLSDATGNTYFNLLDLQQVTNIEIAKGPAASSYGAGTGGAFLLNRSLVFTDSMQQNFRLSFATGSFGYNQQQLEWKSSSKNFVSSLQFHRLQSNGYREQSALLKSGFLWQTAFRLKQHLFSTTLFYTDLFYETPGGITAAQMQLNPKLSRQPAGAFPGAVQQKTAIYNKTLWGALKHEIALSNRMQLKSFISINTTKFANPFITNYEKRKELNLAAGAQLIIQPIKSTPSLQWVNGFEWMMNESSIQNYNNKAGNSAELQSNDIIYSKQGFAFSQLKLSIGSKLLVQAGFSINHQSYEYKRLSNGEQNFTKRKISAPFIPRLSLSYRLNQDLSLYGVLAKGFSAPSLAEIRPSDGNFYPLLNAEQGWNIEAGIRGELLEKRLLVDIGFYQFKLENAIVRRNDAAGAEYFINAGNTLQQGMEALIKYQLVQNNKQFIKTVQLLGSFSYQPYKFKNYQQGAVNFSGNPITGVPNKIMVFGVDINTANKFYWQTSLNITSAIPLNDANTVSAAAYQLLQTKIGKQFTMAKYSVDVFIGGDNLLNQLYSLGNDINAAGNRYFNPAPIRNWYTGIKISCQ